MHISYKWLKQYLPEIGDLNEDDLQSRITASLAEVEEIRPLGESISKIVVGEIVNIQKLPDSKKNTLVEVNTGDKSNRQIICGADNIQKGNKVPVALPGGKILNPKNDLGEQEIIDIKEVVIAGKKSQGMLCSQKELGVSENHDGIWILPNDLEIGLDLVGEIKDQIIEIENKSLTQRPDCFCHMGIARELSAIFRTPFKYEESDETLIPTKSLPLVVKVEDNNLCKRYTAIALERIKIIDSPLWLKLRLLSCGIRPVNNIVDATNYIMLDMGQPLHAFDYDKLSAPRIIVRTAKRGEKIKTLDGEERDLKTNHLLICDPEKPIGIAGVMGGSNTEISDETKDIIIESANFEMYNNRRTGKELGIRSEANTRFEKGPDPNQTLPALIKVVELILEISGGEIASEVIDIYPQKVEETEINFEVSKTKKLLGIDLSKEQVADIFKALDFEIISPETSTTSINVKIPTFRRDLTIEEDLLEEIARIYGYDKFQPTLPERDLKPPPLNEEREYEKKVKQTLSSLGFDEIYTYSFSGEDIYEKTSLDINQCRKLKNPISPELGYMKNHLLPNLLEKLKLNLGNFEEVYIYELSRIFLKDLNTEGIPKQPKNIAGVMSTKNKDEESTFFELKGVVEKLLSNINIENVSFEKKENIKYLHPSAQGTIKSNNKEIGMIGNLHPQVKLNWGLKENTSVFILDFDQLFSLRAEKKKYQKVPMYPYVTRDISFWIKKDQEAGKVLEKLKEVKAKYLQDVEIIDIYEPKKEENKKSIAIKIKLQPKTHTLTEEEINDDIDQVMTMIKKLNGKIRKN